MKSYALKYPSIYKLPLNFSKGLKLKPKVIEVSNNTPSAEPPTYPYPQSNLILPFTSTLVFAPAVRSKIAFFTETLKLKPNYHYA